MKILSVRLLNLNSLRGQWFIDLSSEPFASNGLFAITGPTGAGKTTLLDAICLALYHATPRTDKGDEVMTKGCGECSAEVEFEAAGQRYRAYWYLRRAKKTASGKAQNAKVELARIEGEKAVIIAEKIKEKQDKIAEITGLDFSRFKQSMLLSQGQFAAFLNANSGERSSLLEQMTGTQIYGQISIEVHRQHALAKQRRDEKQLEISHLGLMDAETAAELQTKLARTRAEEQQLADSLTALSVRLQWHDQAAQLRLQRDNLEASLATLDAEAQNHQSDLDRLALARPAATLAPLYQQWQQAEAAMEARAAQLATLDTELKALQQQLEDATSKQSTAVAALDLAKSSQREAERHIREVVAPLDLERQKQGEKLAEIEQQLNRLTEQRNQATAANAALNQQLDNQRHDLSGHQSRLTGSGHFAQIENKLPLWENQFATASKIQDELSALQQQNQITAQHLNSANQQHDALTRQAADADTRRTQTATALDHARQALEASQQGGANTASLRRRINELQEARASLQVLTQLASGYADQFSRKQRCAGTLEQCRLDRGKLEIEIESLRRHYKQQHALLRAKEESLKLKQQIRSLESHRNALKAGEACPLCGATEHPGISQYSENEIDQSEREVHELQEAVEQIKVAGNDCANKLAGLAATETKAAEELTELTTALDGIRDQWQVIIGRHPWQFSPADDSERQTIISETEADLQTTKAAEEAIRELEAAHQSAIDHHQQAENEVAQSRLKLASVKQQLDSIHQTRLERLQRIARCEQELKSLDETHNETLPSPDWAWPASKQREAWLTARQEEFGIWQHTQARIAELTTLIDSTEREHSDTEKRIASIDEAAAQEATARQGLILTLATLQQQREAAFGKKDAEEEMKALRTALDEQERQSEAAKAAVQNLDVKRSALNERRTATRLRLEEEEQQLMEARKHFDIALDASPFTTRSTFESALIADDAFKQLENLETSLRDRHNEVRSALQHCLDQQTAHGQTQPGSAASPEELRARREEAEQQRTALNQQLGALSNEWKTYEEKIQRNRHLQEQLTVCQQALEEWDLLKSLIGSADGKAFRLFAQGLTLQHLVHLANKRLEKLDPRYQLRRKENEQLEMEILDTWQAGISRETRSLSGGESFLVSLALALALSDLVSGKTSIDSLFLDEGFGTLDPGTLEVVLGTLDALNASGKMIGIISHVEALKERIPVQIKVHKSAGLGFSRLDEEYRDSTQHA